MNVHSKLKTLSTCCTAQQEAKAELNGLRKRVKHLVARRKQDESDLARAKELASKWEAEAQRAQEKAKTDTAKAKAGAK